MTNTILSSNDFVITPKCYLRLASEHGHNRTEAIGMTSTSERTFGYWEYEGKFSPTFKKLKELTAIARSQNWL